MSDHHEIPSEARDFEWDDNKRIKNIEKHNIDFAEAMEVFLDLNVDIASKNPGEPRRKATGLLDGRFVTVVYTLRNGAIRIISARRARDDERRAYRALHDPGDP